MTDRIIERAHQIGLSQTDIAKSVNTNRSTVNGWYRGAIPSPDHLHDLRKVLRCSQDYLEGTTNVPGARTENEMIQLLDKTWDLKDDIVSTNTVLIPEYKKRNIENAMAFPTMLIDHVSTYAGLAYLVVDSNLFIFDSQDLAPTSKQRDFMLCIAGVESVIGKFYINLEGKPMAKIDGEIVNLQQNKNIQNLGRIVFSGCRT